VYRQAQVLADISVRCGDPGKRSANGLAHHHASTFPLVRKGPAAPTQPGGSGYLSEEPVALRARAVGTVLGIIRASSVAAAHMAASDSASPGWPARMASMTSTALYSRPNRAVEG
jgi:hypothetical protein